MINLIVMFASVTDFLNEICDWVGSHWDSLLIGLGGTTITGIGIGAGTILLKTLIQKGILKKSTATAQSLTTKIFTDLSNFKSEMLATFKEEQQKSKTEIVLSVENVLDITKQVKAEIYTRLNNGTLTLEYFNANKQNVINEIRAEITKVVDVVNESVDTIKNEATKSSNELIEDIKEDVNQAVEEIKEEVVEAVEEEKKQIII